MGSIHSDDVLADALEDKQGASVLDPSESNKLLIC